MRVQRGLLAALVALSCAALSSCAYKPLKAPCANDEGQAQPLSYAVSPGLSPAGAPFAGLDDACGPMRPVNR